MSGKSNVFIHVYTGDKKFAGTDANIRIILHDEQGNKSQTVNLDNFWKNDFERGKADIFELMESDLKGLQMDGDISKVEFWRDESGVSSDWYVDKISVDNRRTQALFVFPVYRWVRPDYQYVIQLYDTSLPQHDQYHQQREKDLEEKRLIYRYTQKASGLPVQIETLPEDEKFSWDYMWDITTMKMKLIATSKIEGVLGKLKDLFGCGWNNIDDLLALYRTEHFHVPRGADRWRDDVYFGIQRTSSINNTLIELCTAIPDKLPVEDSMLGPVLEGLSIQQALEQKRLFICDLHLLQDVPVRAKCTLCAPICLLFLNKDQQLKPVAIQLFQKPSSDNPIFLPTDDPVLWVLVKMWYNNADAAYHQALTHLGLTHLLMEGVTIASHRQLSQSHPVFKLMAPHFLYILAINSRALETLLSENGWVDNTMNYGTKGLLEVVRRGIKTWRLDIHGTLPQDLQLRGVDDPKVLPCYPFRDDALLLYNAIHRYVSAYVHVYYDSEGEKLKQDKEIQAWASELVRERGGDSGGCGLLGVPGEGSITCPTQLTTILTSIIFTSSVMHASANFSQYDEYGFPPNYPGLLTGQPPKTKDARTEEDIMKCLPDRKTTLDIMTVTRILSRKTTNSLGDFEVNYVFDPQAAEVVAKFRQELSDISQTVKERNERRPVPYTDLDPVNVPNAISI